MTRNYVALAYADGIMAMRNYDPVVVNSKDFNRALNYMRKEQSGQGLNSRDMYWLKKTYVKAREACGFKITVCEW